MSTSSTGAAALSGDDHKRGEIGLCEPDIGDDERQRVWKVLESKAIAYGETVDCFEQAVRALQGRRHAVAVSSGTAALHLALLVAGVRRDDEVLMPTLTFIAPANAASYVGAYPVFFDVEPDYRQFDVERLERWVTDECICVGSRMVRRASGRRIGAVVAVDLLGHPCDIDGLRAAADRLGVPLIDDAAESLGARFRDRPVGDGADIVCLSFNANKIVTSAGGGMVLCDRDDWARDVRHLAAQAKTSEEGYEHNKVGFNYRMASAQAALGRGQLERLGEFLGAKRSNAEHYARELAAIPGIALPLQAPWALCTHWQYAIHVDAEVYGLSARGLAKELERRQIASRPIFTPLHQRGPHAGRQAHPCPVAERIGAGGLILPSSAFLEAEQLKRVTDAIRSLGRTTPA